MSETREQGAFTFDREGVVLRWRMGWLVARWENGAKAFFRSWDEALAHTLHPVNTNVLLRIRP